MALSDADAPSRSLRWGLELCTSRIVLYINARFATSNTWEVFLSLLRDQPPPHLPSSFAHIGSRSNRITQVWNKEHGSVIQQSAHCRRSSQRPQRRSSRTHRKLSRPESAHCKCWSLFEKYHAQLFGKSTGPLQLRKVSNFIGSCTITNAVFLHGYLEHPITRLHFGP